MTSIPRLLAAAGIALAGPAFLLNVAAHGGVMPGPDEVDRVDGLFSLMFMLGAASVVTALLLAQPSPLGRKGRWLLHVDAAMITLGGIWSAAVMVDPQGVIDSNNPILLVGDASWPLHQVLMLVTGVVAVRANRWPDPARWTLFGPAIGLALLSIGAILDADAFAAGGIGAGWTITAAGLLAATASCAPQRPPRALEPAA